MQRIGKTGRSNPPLLNAVLIPSMASADAAIGTVVAEGVVFAVQFWALRKEVLSAWQMAEKVSRMLFKKRKIG